MPVAAAAALDYSKASITRTTRRNGHHRPMEPLPSVGSRRVTRTSLLTALLALAASGAAHAGSASLTGELQKQVRGATFEVVLRKPEKDNVTYEKPLPLELMPFQERNDKYWSIGTAFAIGATEFVTAGHVLIAGVSSQFGVPGIRDSAGNVYPLERVLKYHNHEDFAVFSVSGAPSVTPLPTDTHASVDDAVFAVGNALGEGVVIRDGLLTSLTPRAEGRQVEVAALLSGRLPRQQRRSAARCAGSGHRRRRSRSPRTRISITRCRSSLS